MSSREQRAKRTRRRRLQKALGPHRWAAAQQQKRLAREALRVQEQKQAEDARQRREAALLPYSRLRDYENRQKAVCAAVGVMAARLKAREERRAKADYERAHAERDLPMTAMQWSPSSGR
jgi:hypothetical protein